MCIRQIRKIGSDSGKLLEGAGLADGLESLEVLEFISNCHSTSSLDNGLDGHNGSSKLNCLGKFLWGRISLAWLLGADGEQDQF